MKKLTDHKGLNGLRVSGKVLMEIKAIKNNEEVKAALQGLTNMNEENSIDTLIDIANVLLSVVPENVLNILAYVDGVETSVKYEQDLTQVFDDIIAVAEDKPLIDFFMRAFGMKLKRLSDTSPTALDMTEQQ